MSILTSVESKGWRGRLFLAAVTLLLIIGGATMLYPFVLMLSGAMRSQMDSADMSVVPEYFADDAVLVQKFLETKYNFNPPMMNLFRQETSYSFTDAGVPAIHEQAADDLERFFMSEDMPDHWQVLGATEIVRLISSRKHRELIDRLMNRYDGNLESFNADMGVFYPSWWTISVELPAWEEHRALMREDPLLEEYFELMRESHPAYRALVNLSSHFLNQMVFPQYGRSGIDRFREESGLEIESFQDFFIGERAPSGSRPLFREKWLNFIFDGNVNISFVRSDADDSEYRDFLRDRFGDLEQLKTYWPDAEYDSFEDIRLPGDREWIRDFRREAYSEFLQTLPPESLRLVGPEFAWRRFLEERYGSPEAAARAHGVELRGWEGFRMPLDQVETRYVLSNSGRYRRDYMFRNFRLVTHQMFIQGRPFFNTIVYVILSLLFALTVQPLVAYSLSRFRPPGTWKIIFIFVATMAFPPMVGMIPRFLVIKNLGLLNTYIALVLPVAVNGMLIFLLKGFFDSIPKDLYDAAVIDGASEMRIFWQVTMSMSKPILAVVALSTFSGAWMAFLYPLIVCPDERMHVLAVWLQQFQLEAPGEAVFASIIIASIPSLVIFLFAQRTIMRGIAVPSEK